MTKSIYYGYDAKNDITIIYEDTYNLKGELIKFRIVSFYFGEPNEKDIELFYNRDYKKSKLQANFEI